MEDRGAAYFQRNQQWLKPGDHQFNTPLAPDQEAQFRQWVTANRVPFDVSAPVSDYDMRGFWSALQRGDPLAKSAVDPNDQRLHYPDYWKTPYHQTFSRESQWALPGAPAWNDRDQLVTPDGQVLFDDRARAQAAPAVALPQPPSDYDANVMGMLARQLQR